MGLGGRNGSAQMVTDIALYSVQYVGAARFTHLDDVGVRDGCLGCQLQCIPGSLLLCVAVPTLGDFDSHLDTLTEANNIEGHEDIKGFHIHHNHEQPVIHTFAYLVQAAVHNSKAS